VVSAYLGGPATEGQPENNSETGALKR
jgi:hypothetical protein